MDRIQSVESPQPSTTPHQPSIMPRLALSAAASVVAELATLPLDVAKIRLQLDTARLPNEGMIARLAAVVKARGFGALYSGAAPAVLRHIIYTPARIFIFESLKNSNKNNNNNNNTPLPSLLWYGFVAGGAGQLLAVPADLVKVRLQADAASSNPRYKGTLDAFSTIVKSQGVRGLWRGSGPAVQRAALVNLGELSTYSSAKAAVMRSGITGGEDGLATHMASSGCSGFVAAVVSTPADVVKSRLMAGAQGGRRQMGMVACFVAALRDEGVRGLYKGFLPTYLRLAPWQLTFWVTYEELRRVAGLGGF